MSRLGVAAPAAASRLTTGPVVLGAALIGAAGYAIALWFARMAVLAERVEEQQYCGPGPHTGGPAPHLPVQAGPARTGQPATGAAP
jgi:hypothetical protein